MATKKFWWKCHKTIQLPPAFCPLFRLTCCWIKQTNKWRVLFATWFATGSPFSVTIICLICFMFSLLVCFVYSTTSKKQKKKTTKKRQRTCVLTTFHRILIDAQRKKMWKKKECETREAKNVYILSYQWLDGKGGVGQFFIINWWW